MKSPIIIVSTLLPSPEDQCLEMENSVNHLQELLLLSVKGMHMVSSVLATDKKPVGVVVFIAVYEILAIVEEFTAQILTYTQEHASHVKSYF